MLQIASFLHTKLQSLSLEERAGLREYLRLKNSQKPLSVCCNFLTVSGFELPSAVTWNVLGSEKTLCKLQNVFSTIEIFFIFVWSVSKRGARTFYDSKSRNCFFTKCGWYTGTCIPFSTLLITMLGLQPISDWRATLKPWFSASGQSGRSKFIFLTPKADNV